MHLQRHFFLKEDRRVDYSHGRPEGDRSWGYVSPSGFCEYLLNVSLPVILVLKMNVHETVKTINSIQTLQSADATGNVYKKNSEINWGLMRNGG